MFLCNTRQRLPLTRRRTAPEETAYQTSQRWERGSSATGNKCALRSRLGDSAGWGRLLKMRQGRTSKGQSAQGGAAIRAEGSLLSTAARRDCERGHGSSRAKTFPLHGNQACSRQPPLLKHGVWALLYRLGETLSQTENKLRPLRWVQACKLKLFTPVTMFYFTPRT